MGNKSRRAKNHQRELQTNRRLGRRRVYPFTIEQAPFFIFFYQGKPLFDRPIHCTRPEAEALIQNLNAVTPDLRQTVLDTWCAWKGIGHSSDAGQPENQLQENEFMNDKNGRAVNTGDRVNVEGVVTETFESGDEVTGTVQVQLGDQGHLTSITIDAATVEVIESAAPAATDPAGAEGEQPEPPLPEDPAPSDPQTGQADGAGSPDPLEPSDPALAGDPNPLPATDPSSGGPSDPAPPSDPPATPNPTSDPANAQIPETPEGAFEREVGAAEKELENKLDPPQL